MAHCRPMQASVLTAVTAVVFCLSIAGAGPARTETSPRDINALIPQTPNGKACFTGRFDSRPLASEHAINPNTSGVVSYRYATHKVKAVTLQVLYEDTPPHPDSADIPGYARRYNFRLAVRLAERKSPLYAAGECPWRDKHFVAPDGRKIPPTTASLHCGIDCDGGGMTLEPLPEANALLLRLDKHERLRMSAPCEDGSLVFNGRDDGQVFRLAEAKAAACQPIERWIRRR
jgi:hypothetical protein